MKQDIRDAWRAVRASGTPDTTAYQQVGDSLCERLETAERMVHELQKDNTRLVEERRAAKRPIREQVLEFHRAMGVPVLERPVVPADERVRLRLRLVAEEFFELLEAAFGGSCDGKSPIMDQINGGESRAHLGPRPLRVGLPEFADALADLDYVIEGARLEFGIDGAPVAVGVHAANMRKLDGPVREDGKIQKPEGWQPFDVAAELRRQGWEEQHGDG